MNLVLGGRTGSSQGARALTSIEHGIVDAGFDPHCPRLQELHGGTTPVLLANSTIACWVWSAAISSTADDWGISRLKDGTFRSSSASVTRSMRRVQLLGIVSNTTCRHRQTIGVGQAAGANIGRNQAMYVQDLDPSVPLTRCPLCLASRTSIASSPDPKSANG